MQGRSRNFCCRTKPINIAYSECVSVALVIQRAICISRIVICGPSGSTFFFQHHIIIGKNKRRNWIRMCNLIFSTDFVCNISHSKNNSASFITDVHRSVCKVPLFLIYFNTLTTGLLNCLNARSPGITFRHRASCT